MDILSVAKRRPIVFPLACAAAATMLVISEASYWHSVDTLDDLGAMAGARNSIRGMQQSILAAEAGQRGYLLTNRKEYLQPYDKALKEVDESFSSLAAYFANEPAAAEVLAQLRALTATKLSELAVAVRLHEQGKHAESTDIVLSELNKKQMEAITKLALELLASEEQKVAQRRGAIYLMLLLSRIGMAALSAISLLALAMYLRQSLALRRQQQEQQRLVQAERDRLEVVVAQRTAQLTDLARHLQSAREDERHRLARNLHDDLGALLTSAKLDAARIRSRLAGTAPEALERLTHLVDTLNSGIALGRRIIEDLRPSTLGNLGLVATLEILTREFAADSGVEAHCALAPVKLEATTELVIYRVVQEALTNIAKYAKARHVWLSLTSTHGQAAVEVRDDGIGFDPGARQGPAYGLVGMRFRVEAEGGTMTLVAAPGQGTTIRVTLPEAGREARPERRARPGPSI